MALIPTSQGLIFYLKMKNLFTNGCSYLIGKEFVFWIKYESSFGDNFVSNHSDWTRIVNNMVPDGPRSVNLFSRFLT